MIAVDEASTVPPYEQVRRQLAADIASGQLPAGVRLPTVRALAADLKLATNTVARSYRELEAAGLVETRGRAGTVVTAGGDRGRERLVAAARHYATSAKDLGIDRDEARRVVSAALDDS